MPNEPIIPRLAAGTIINKENFNEIARAVLGGATLIVGSGGGGGALIGYTPQFFPQPWVDFVDPVQAGGDNGFNKRFQDIVVEFNRIAAAISSVDEAVANLQTAGGSVIGLTITPFMHNGAKIPVPMGFQPEETMFFAYFRGFNVTLDQAGTGFGFDVSALSDGTVVALGNSGGGVSAVGVVATGIALAKKGGWGF